MIVWQQQIDDVRFEVRTAGQTRRLYTNGVFHSQYHPDYSVTGSVWDLLLLPAFFFTPRELQRILVLGVGGGTVIRQIRRFFHPEQITGVEVSATHIEIARRFFALTPACADLVCADAQTWVNDYQGRGFDLIIDDAFTDADHQPMRAIEASPAWFYRLHTLLRPGGILVMNFISRAELLASGFFHTRSVRRGFKSAFQLTNPRDENHVGVFSRRPVTSRHLRQQLFSHADLKRAYDQNRLQYRIRHLYP